MQKAQRGAGLFVNWARLGLASNYAWQLLQWALVIAIALGIGCPRWVRRALSLPASKRPVLDVIVAILWAGPLGIFVSAGWPTAIAS